MNSKVSGFLLILYLASICSPSATAEWPVFDYRDTAELEIDHHLEAEEKAHLSRDIKILQIGPAADPDLFASKRLFPKLVQVTLTGDSVESLLKGLAQNYPNISALLIRQSAPLSSIELSYLKRFKHLQFLGLYGRFLATKHFENFLPKNLKVLSIDQTCDLPVLPSLVKLTVRNCTVNASFLRGIRAPKMKNLSLIEAQLEPGALDAIVNFPNLELLCLPKELDSERQNIQRLTHARIYIAGDPVSRPPQVLTSPR